MRGDTLWDLASRFLRDPWCWPDVWADNRDSVSNPHLIYPGQQIRLDRARGLLTSANTATDIDTQALPIVRRTPTLRAEAIAIAGDRIIGVGARRDLEHLRAATTRIIDAQGRRVGGTTATSIRRQGPFYARGVQNLEDQRTESGHRILLYAVPILRRSRLRR